MKKLLTVLFILISEISSSQDYNLTSLTFDLKSNNLGIRTDLYKGFGVEINARYKKITIIESLAISPEAYIYYKYLKAPAFSFYCSYGYAGLFIYDGSSEWVHETEVQISPIGVQISPLNIPASFNTELFLNKHESYFNFKLLVHLFKY